MYGKIVIRCELKVLTGMHIGASGAFSAIGAVSGFLKFILFPSFPNLT